MASFPEKCKLPKLTQDNIENHRRLHDILNLPKMITFETALQMISTKHSRNCTRM